MRVPEMFSDHGMFMFLYALMEMVASVSNIIHIAQITYEFIYHTLLVDQGRLFFCDCDMKSSKHHCNECVILLSLIFKCNFLQYYSLLSAIPREWKTMLKQECSLPLTEYVTLSNKKLTCKITILYSITSASLLQLQRNDSLNVALTFKKDKKYTHFLFVLQMK